jgi:hypothetical protein
MGRIFQGLLVESILSVIKSKNFGIIKLKANEALAFLAELIVAGKEVITIDRRYSSIKRTAALRHFEEGRFTSKIVSTIAK